jgi:hypothetical protein
MPESYDHYAVIDRQSATAAPAPLTPEQLDIIEWTVNYPGPIANIRKPVLAALLAAYRREVRMHLNNAYRYLHQAGELRLGPNRSDWLERAAEHLEAAGYSGLAAGVRDDYADFPDVMDALREALRIGEGEK